MHHSPGWSSSSFEAEILNVSGARKRGVVVLTKRKALLFLHPGNDVLKTLLVAAFALRVL